MKLNIFQNDSQSISLLNTNKLNKTNHLLKTETKKEHQNNKDLKNFTPKQKLYNNNLILTNIPKEKKLILSKNIQKGTSIKKINSNAKANSNIHKEKTIKLISTKYSYNKYLTKENISSKKNINNTKKILYSPITHNKNIFRVESKEKNKKPKNNKKINNITLIKNQFSKSMVENNSISSLNIIYSNNNSNKKTSHTEKILVIDLDETLIHTSFKKLLNYDFKILLDSTIYTQKNLEDKIIKELSVQKIVEAYICIRPGVNEFLSQLSNYYDLYVYSASSKQYLNNVIKNLDKKNIIKKCYCRDDCIIYVENTEEDFDIDIAKKNNKYNYVKDLKKINKDLRNIVFIDNNIMSFKLQEKNGIPIKSWYDDNDDIELYKLIPILKNLSGFYDVRIEIEKFVNNKTFIWSKSINWLKENCLNTAYLNEVNLILKIEQQKSEFKFDNNINKINNNKTGKNKIINHINNILINLNEISSNNINKSEKHMVNKPNNFYNKIETDFNLNQLNQKFKNKTLNTKDISFFNTDKKTHLIRNKKTKTLTNEIINKSKFSESTQKTKINSSNKKNNKDKNIIKTILPHQRSIYLPKLNLTYFNFIDIDNY